MTKLMAPAGGKLRDPAPAGMHAGRIIQIIDMGDPDGTYGKKRKVNLVFELPDCRDQFTYEDDDGVSHDVDRPHRVYAWCTLSSHKRSKLRALMEGMYGKEFNDDKLLAAGGFDLAKVLGRPCTVHVMHSDANKAIVKGLAPASGDVPEAEGDVFMFVIDAEEGFDAELFAKLPDWQREQIMETDLYRDVTGESGPPSVTDADIPF